MTLTQITDWLAQNRDGLLLGLAVGLGLVAAMLLVRSYGQRVVARDPEATGWRAVAGRVLAKTGLWFMVFAAADAVATYADLPRRLAHIIDIGFTIAFAIQGAIWGRELILGLIGRRVAADKGSGLASAMAIIRVLVSVALFAIAGILILDNLGVNVTALVAGLGIGGIAIGLAAQGIFSDLFAALSILFDKPFKKGDTIRYDNSTGTVERIGLKTTRLRSMTGEQLIMANTKLLEREIHNLAEARARRFTLHLAVGGEASVRPLRPFRSRERRTDLRPRLRQCDAGRGQDGKRSRRHPALAHRNARVAQAPAGAGVGPADSALAVLSGHCVLFTRLQIGSHAARHSR
jgi:small-conductance mechanosensitive channel